LRILDTRRRARELRREQTPAETALWELLRDRQILGLKFRRQTPISRYIADFCCPDLRLVVELDGEVHSTEAQIAHDQNRDEYLQALGYEVLRFPNERLLSDPGSVLDQITQAALTLRPSLAHKLKLFSPSPGEGDGEAGEGAGG
jgi:very-short-patch-repair endonuclease